MPYQVSWQSVSMKSQRPVHVLGAALAADTPQQAPAAARIVAAKIPSFVMTAPCLNTKHRDLKKVSYKTEWGMTRKFRPEWPPRHSATASRVKFLTGVPTANPKRLTGRRESADTRSR